MRAATYNLYQIVNRRRFQSTLPMRAATVLAVIFYAQKQISIHAAHAGSDRAEAQQQQMQAQISIHAAHAGSDKDKLTIQNDRMISIHAAHAGSDRHLLILNQYQNDFNPRCPCGQRQHKCFSSDQ